MQKKLSEKPMDLFKKRVYEVVGKIKKGQVLTYKKVAELAQSPRAWRAVGNALNNNPDLKNIPCHRVVRSDGGIGGYKFGIKRKMTLLKKEGVVMRRGRVAN